MIVREGDCLRVTQPMVMANAAALLQAGQAALTQGEEIVDLAAVSALDSSALAVMLAWLRSAREQGRSLRFASPPDGLRALIGLYGLDDVLSFR